MPGLAVTLAYALGLRGLIAAADRRREGRPGSALVGALGGIALAAGLGGVIAGLVIVARPVADQNVASRTPVRIRTSRPTPISTR